MEGEIEAQMLIDEEPAIHDRREALFDLYCQLKDCKLPAGLSLSRFFGGMGFRINGFYFGRLIINSDFEQAVDVFRLITFQNGDVWRYNDDKFNRGEAHFSSCEELLKICLSLTTPRQVASQE